MVGNHLLRRDGGIAASGVRILQQHHRVAMAQRRARGHIHAVLRVHPANHQLLHTQVLQHGQQVGFPEGIAGGLVQGQVSAVHLQAIGQLPSGRTRFQARLGVAHPDDGGVGLARCGGDLVDAGDQAGAIPGGVGAGAEGLLDVYEEEGGHGVFMRQAAKAFSCRQVINKVTKFIDDCQDCGAKARSKKLCAALAIPDYYLIYL